MREQGIINPKKVAYDLALIAALLIMLNVGAELVRMRTGDRYIELVRVFMLGSEKNIPTYFSSLLLLAAGLVLAVIATTGTQHGNEYGRHWRALSIIFVLLSFDETVGLHEMMNYPLLQLLDLDGVFLFGFLILAIPMVGALAILYARFLIQLPSKVRLLLVLSAVLYLGGQIGFEMLGGLVLQRYAYGSMEYFVVTTLEESLEMAGIIVFIYGLLLYAAKNLPEIRFRLGARH